MPDSSPPDNKNSKTDKVPKVSVNDVMKEVGGEQARSGVKLTLTPTQQAGMWLAAGVGLIILLVIIVVSVSWLQHVPSMPAQLLNPANGNAEAADAMLKNYNSLYSTAIDHSMRLFDVIVVKALLPVFTTILGYIFGSRAAREGA